MGIWTTDVTPEEINQRCRNTLSDHLGIEFIAVDEDSMSARMKVSPKTNQPLGLVHGGATAALAETVASAAANHCAGKGKFCVGIELNINHIRAIKNGSVTAVAKPLHIGKSTQVWEIKIENDAGQLVSAARLTLAVIAKD